MRCVVVHLETRSSAVQRAPVGLLSRVPALPRRWRHRASPLIMPSTEAISVADTFSTAQLLHFGQQFPRGMPEYGSPFQMELGQTCESTTWLSNAQSDTALVQHGGGIVAVAVDVLRLVLLLLVVMVARLALSSRWLG